MAIHGTGALDQARLNELRAWFAEVQSQPVQTAGQKQILDTFTKAGIATASQIAAGENIGKLLEQTAAKLDDIVQMTRRCPAGKQAKGT